MAYAGTGLIFPQNFTDNTSRYKVTLHQNIFEADFEYGTQPLRWEIFTAGNGTVVSQPGSGGVAMSITAASGDITVRQSRPYHRYQPGKTMYMATGFNFGTAATNQRQRVGFMDDANGLFFEQADPTSTNPYGMFVAYRDDINRVPVDTRISFENWLDPDGVKNSLNWNNIQMLWIEYAWYGAGLIRWGVIIGGVPRTLHQIGIGNLTGQGSPWSRTGNLPVRYEQRNIGSSSSNVMYHYGVSVIAEGRQDEQRGFTYSYGMALGIPRRQIPPGTTRFPIISIRARTMGTQEFAQNSAAITGTPTTSTLTVASLPAITSITVSGTTATLVFASAHSMTTVTGFPNTINISGATPAVLNGTWTVTRTSSTNVTFTVPTGAATATVVGVATPWYVGQWVGRYVFFPGTGSQGDGSIGRITANTTTTLTYVDNITGNPISTAPAAAANYTIGIINRGLILPKGLKISSDTLCQVELIASIPGNPVVLTGSTFTGMNGLGSPNSLAERDVSATALSGGEVVYAFTSPAGGSGLQDLDLTNLFPLYNVIQGNRPDILSVAISTSAAVTEPSVSSAVISGITGTLTFATAHSLLPGQSILLAGFTPSSWNGTYVIVSVPTATTLTIAVAASGNSSVQGTVTTVTNVGAHLVGQEQMS